MIDLYDSLFEVHITLGFKSQVSAFISSKCQLASLRLDISEDDSVFEIRECLSSSDDIYSNLIYDQLVTNCITLHHLHVHLIYGYFIEHIIEHVLVLEILSIRFRDVLAREWLHDMQIKPFTPIVVNWYDKNLCLNTRDLSILQEFVALLSLFVEATTATQRQNSPSISLAAPSILAIYFDLINEKKNIQYTTALCEALLSSLLSKFGGLLEQTKVDLNELNINFQMNKKFYDLYKDPVFLFSSFLNEMFKIRWITESLLPDSTKERLCEKI
ncbi:unnamed protein product [Rotaria sp. Silwood2]|nr:unnamed protein product [Rotaria sp. Silwood2]CAF4044122.1 unnamed protein product [Rotaria sp. Silwood2]